eukprot:1161371-Pelagomonas_calceolata.AAC.17
MTQHGGDSAIPKQPAMADIIKSVTVSGKHCSRAHLVHFWLSPLKKRCTTDTQKARAPSTQQQPFT